jgi:hypothetical protein
MSESLTLVIVQGDDQRVHKATRPPLAACINEELRVLQFTFEQSEMARGEPFFEG